jgi:hypothetical protein
MTAPAEEGDRAEYETCHRADCSAHREGTHHAHLARVVRGNGADATPPLRNAAPAVPDVRA